MADRIQWSDNHMEKSDDAHLGIMSLDNVAKARAFHKSFPQYTVTPLARLDNLAARLGLNNLCVKDESYRFGLNAFKVLGGSFAMASYIADETRPRRLDMTYDYLTSDELARDFGQATFFTYRWQPRPRCRMGCQAPGPEGRRAHAQGFHQASFRQYRRRGRDRDHRRGQL